MILISRSFSKINLYIKQRKNQKIQILLHHYGHSSAVDLTQPVNGSKQMDNTQLVKIYTIIQY